MARTAVVLNVNGGDHSLEVDARVTLLDALYAWNGLALSRSRVLQLAGTAVASATVFLIAPAHAQMRDERQISRMDGAKP